MKKIIIIFLFIIKFNSYASSCRYYYQEGSVPGWGQVALNSSLSTLSASLLFMTEAKYKDSGPRKSLAKQSFIAPILYLYPALITWCPPVSQKEYERKKKAFARMSDHEKSQAKIKTAERPTPQEFQESVLRWKKIHRYFGLSIGAINSYHLIRIAQESQTEGLKSFAYGAIIYTMWLTFRDEDNLFNDKLPPWANAEFALFNINDDFSSGIKYSFAF